MKRKYGKRVDGTQVELVAHQIIAVSSIPACNFCTDGTPGEYDFKTVMGPWANGCTAHYEQYRAFAHFGTGKAQLWIDRKTVEEVMTAN